MLKRSSSSAEIRLFKLDYENVIKQLKSYAEEVVRNGALAVILIGSLARGDYTAFSDADVVIVLSESRDKPLDRVKAFLNPTLPVDLNPFVYTLNELMTMAAEKRKIVEEIVNYGKILAGNKEIIEKLKERLTIE